MLDREEHDELAALGSQFAHHAMTGLTSRIGDDFIGESPASDPS